MDMCQSSWLALFSCLLLSQLIISVECSTLTTTPKRVLVLGGTGFVGSEVIRQANQRGFEVVSVSRRGQVSTGEQSPSPSSNWDVKWVQGDAADASQLQRIVNENGPFDACVHAIGLLLDNESGLSQYNKLVSGSGSEPGPESSYDRYVQATLCSSLYHSFLPTSL